MTPTQKVTHTDTFVEPEVAGVRVLGKDRVYWFNEVRDPDGYLDIGRTPKRSIHIRDRSVSVVHCLIRHRSDGKYEMIDTRSTNGIYVCNLPGLRPYRQVYHHVLEVGLHIKLGRAQLVTVSHDDDRPLLIARSLSQFGRLALNAYGTVCALVNRLGFTKHKAQQHRQQLNAMNEALTQGQAESEAKDQTVDQDEQP